MRPEKSDSFRSRVTNAINGTGSLSEADRELALFHIRNGTALGYAFLNASYAAINRPTPAGQPTAYQNFGGSSPYPASGGTSYFSSNRGSSDSSADSSSASEGGSNTLLPDPPGFQTLWNYHNGSGHILFNDDGTAKYANQCAIRFSEAYIEAGFGLPGFRGVKDQGYALRALELKTWLTKIYGKPTVIREENALSSVEGKQGIIVIEQFKGISDPDYRFNHVDLWNGSSFRGGDRQWLNQPKTAVYFWEVK